MDELAAFRKLTDRIMAEREHRAAGTLHELVSHPTLGYTWARLCYECSTDSNPVYHTPEEPCPKRN